MRREFGAVMSIIMMLLGIVIIIFALEFYCPWLSERFSVTFNYLGIVIGSIATFIAVILAINSEQRARFDQNQFEAEPKVRCKANAYDYSKSHNYIHGKEPIETINEKLVYSKQNHAKDYPFTISVANFGDKYLLDGWLIISGSDQDQIIEIGNIGSLEEKEVRFDVHVTEDEMKKRSQAENLDSNSPLDTHKDILMELDVKLAYNSILSKEKPYEISKGFYNYGIEMKLTLRAALRHHPNEYADKYFVNPILTMQLNSET